MTNDEINIAIAEWCGWHDFPCRDRAIPPGNTSTAVEDTKQIPNYCADLNAIHEAEMKLTMNQWSKYLRFIVPAESNWLPEGDDIPNAFSLICHATARQRAEALLRTIGKWTE